MHSARYVINKDRANPAFDVIAPKIYNKIETPSFKEEVRLNLT
jgi:hypothetical protein